MRLIFSLSSDLNKLCNFGFPDTRNAVDKKSSSSCSQSHSTQLAWRLHSFRLGESYVLIATESYSCYTLLFPLLQALTWPQILDGFLESYKAEVFSAFEAGGFVGWHQRAIVERNFQAMGAVEVVSTEHPGFRQYDLYTKHCLQKMLSEPSAQIDLKERLKALSTRLNQRPQPFSSQQGEAVFFPLERFLSDSLYRFARGLCDVDIPGYKTGQFPNPHRVSTELCVVRG